MTIIAVSEKVSINSEHFIYSEIKRAATIERPDGEYIVTFYLMTGGGTSHSKGYFDVRVPVREINHSILSYFSITLPKEITPVEQPSS